MSRAPKFYSVKNWERYQHYDPSKRRISWIKLYRDLLEDYAYAGLPDACKAHLIGVFLLCVKQDNKVPNDPKWVAREIHATEPVNLEMLRKAGFLVPWRASKPLSKPEQPASTMLDIPRGDARSQEQSRAEQVPEQAVLGPSSTSGERPASFKNGNLGTDSMGYALQLAAVLTDKDEGTMRVVTSYAGKLPSAAFVTVREKVLEANPRKPSAYAVSELKRMLIEGQYAR